MRLTVGLVVTCLAGGALAGCGGSSKTNSSISSPGTSSGSVTTSARPFSATTQSHVRQAVLSAMNAGGYPGMVVAIWAPSGSYVQAFGTSDLATGSPMSTDDRLRIGSITKTFTATVIVQLMQEGKLSLSDKLSKFEPQITNASKITIRELLNHTSGLPTNAPSTVRHVFGSPQTPLTPSQAIAATTPLPPLSAPGTAYHYSDTGYLILGEVASKVTHTPIGTLIQRQLLAPLGLHHTTYAAGTGIPSPGAHGYIVLHGNRTDTTNWSYSWTGSAGSMASTVGDLRVYAQALATGSGLLNAATQKQRLQFIATNVPGVSYGLGIFQLGSFLGHDGEIPGYDSIMLYSPSQRVGLIVLGNNSPDLQIPRSRTPVSTAQVAESVYAIVFPGHSLGASAGIG